MLYKTSIILSLCVGVAPSLLEAGVIYVDADATGNGTGADWANAYTTISSALAAASSGDEIWVAEGTYSGGISLIDGVALYGGFAGSESSLSERDCRSNLTYINGGGQVVRSVDNDSSAVLSGFHITGGSTAAITSTGSDKYGGGLYLESSDSTIDWCVIEDNTSQSLGAGVAIMGGSPSFENCIFYDNTATWSAGGVYIELEATPTFLNSLFYDNHAMEGGAVVNASGTPTFVNCTFAKNVAHEPNLEISGRGAGIWDRGGTVLRNCIIWDNDADSAGTESIFNPPNSTGTTATYSDIELASGTWTGTGNINSDPQFLNSDPSVGLYQLMYASPCIDTGDPNDDGAGQTDLDEDARKVGDYVDMGADEFYDCNDSDLIDLCDVDCDAADGNCDVTGCGQSDDCNNNQIPDECETANAACCLIGKLGGGYCISTTASDCQSRGGEFNCGSTCAQVICVGTNGPQGP